MKIISKMQKAININKEMSKSVSAEIADENLTIVKILTFVAAIVFSVMTLVSTFSQTIHKFFPAYLFFFLLESIICICSQKMHSILSSQILTHVFTLSLLIFGVILGSVFSPDELTVAFVVLMFALPLFFIPSPISSTILTILSIIVYFVIASFTETADMLKYNMINILIFGILSIIVSILSCNYKVQKLYVIKENAALEQVKIETELDRENYESFINEMIRNASSQADPDQILNQLLKFIGEKLNSDRAYIFEENSQGSYDNTFEWCRDGVSAEIDNLKGLPYEGLMETWFTQYKKKRNVLIYDIEKYKYENRPMYKILKPQGINTLVTGPITIDGKMIGFYGVDNPPTEIMDSISELLNMMEFIFSMIIRLKNKNDLVEAAAVHDTLTECKNRSALTWIYEGKFDHNQPIAAIMCDLNGLKQVNDLQGHIAGDEFILRVSGILKVTFGKENVYRIGGDEFLVILLGNDLNDLSSKIDSLRLTLGNTASFGIEYRDKMDTSFDELLKEVDKKMYAEKHSYYVAHPEKKDSHHVIMEYNDILSSAGLGIWHIILKDGVRPRMQVNEKMAELLGIDSSKMSEEEIYDSWHDRIMPEALPSVNASVGEMLAGRFSENTYLWNHPVEGPIYVRCGGTAIKLDDGTNMLRGYHGYATNNVMM